MRTHALVAVVGLALVMQGSAGAAEVKVIGLVGLRPLMADLGPAFERSSGHRLVMQYGSGAEGKQRVESGEPFDLAVLNPGLIAELAARGKVVGKTAAVLFRNGVGAVMPAYAAKRDIGTVEGFRQAVLEVKSIAYTPGRASGIHVDQVFKWLGLTEVVKAKIRPQPAPEHVAKAVAAGEAELGFAAMSLLVGMPGVQVIGPLPAQLQDYIVFTAAIGTQAAQADAAKALIAFFGSPSGMAAIKAKGMEPGAPK